MTTAREENARTLAAAIGETEAEADRLLDKPVLITAADGAERLAGYIRALLGRTFTHVLAAPKPGMSPRVEILVGGGAPRTAATAISVGVEGWCIEVRDGRTTALGGRTRPIVELLAACYASAAAVHRAAGPGLPVALQLPIAVDLASLYGPAIGRLEERIDLGSCFLAGAGAIGNAVILGLSVLDVHGEVHVCDPDTASDGNLNRCWWFDQEDLGKSKAERLVSRAQASVPGLRLVPRSKTLRGGLEEAGVAAPATLIVAVDSRRARRNLQNEMPQRVFDASTTGITEVVLHFNAASSGMACLSCVYFEAIDETAHERHVAEALGVTVAEVRTNFVSALAARHMANKYPLLDPTSIEGLAYDSLFKELCGKGELRVSATERVLAPFAFVSVMAGVMLALEMVIRGTPTNDSTKYYNYWRLSPWAPPVARARERRQQKAGCEFCSNETLQSVVKQIWGEHGFEGSLGAADRSAFIDGTSSVLSGDWSRFEEAPRFAEIDALRRRSSDARHLDFHLVRCSHEWLPLPAAALGPDERARVIHFWRVALDIVAARPRADLQRRDHQYPHEDEVWVLQNVAAVVLQLQHAENPRLFWEAVIDLHSEAHDWPEKFLNALHRRALSSESTPATYEPILREVVQHAFSDVNGKRRWPRHEEVWDALIGIDYWVSDVWADRHADHVLRVWDTISLWMEKAPQDGRRLGKFAGWLSKPAAASIRLRVLPWFLEQFRVGKKRGRDREDDAPDNVARLLNVVWDQDQVALRASNQAFSAFRGLLAWLVERQNSLGLELQGRIGGLS